MSIPAYGNSDSLAGWGRYPKISGRILHVETLTALKSCLAAEPGILGRGLGRSYGDAALSSTSCLVPTGRLNRILSFDAEKGSVRCEPGVTIADLITTFLPMGWFPPVTPGTKQVTMGGSFASDIHGKNHHRDGSFANFVNSFELLTAAGQNLHCSPEENSALFWATAGGMGLTGMITELELSLRPVESQYMIVKKIRCTGLAETFQQIEKNEQEYQYSVSWIDCLSSGKGLGRSILMLGRHASRSELDPELQSLHRGEASWALKVPMDMPSWLLNRYSIAAFNSVYFHLSSAGDQEKISFYEPYFYPLDYLEDWNRMYGKAGFVQYQCVLPLASSKEGMEEILALSSKRGRSSFFAVLKKFGGGNKYLSFPIAGYTLALDMPVKPGLFEFTQELDELVIKYGGRVYLAKDSCVSPQSFSSMYHELPDWLAIKNAIDPKKIYRSAMSDRLGL